LYQGGAGKPTRRRRPEPRVSATAIQTVGSMGYGGFALALATEDREH
jgi:hypothetical protein